MCTTLRPGWLVLLVAVWAGTSSTAAAQSWVNVTGNLANMQSECGNLVHLSAAPDSSGRVIAGVALRGLWVNTSGTSWTQLGTGSGSDAIVNRPMYIAYDPVNPAVFWEAGIYNSGGVYKTTDNGTTFRRLGSIAHNDNISVDFTDPNRQVLLAGGHEQSQTVYRSTNGGQTWTNVGTNLPAGTKFSSIPIVISPQVHLVNASGWGTTGGIYRTTSGGSSWERVSAFEPVLPPLVASNGTIYWAVWNGLIKSTDAGVTWTQVASGVVTAPPVELPDRRVVAMSGNRLLASSDGGATWAAFGPALPYTPYGITYSASRRAFFIWKSDCNTVVASDAVMRFDYDVAGPSLPGPPLNLRITSP